MTLRVANGAGFLGDWLAAPRRLVEAAEVDVLTLEYLAELTLSILARIREKNPQAGYANDLLEVLRDLTEPLRNQSQLKIVTNGGGMNSLACARAAGEILAAAGMGGDVIGVVTGDDLLPRIDELLAAGVPLANMATGEPLSAIRERVVSANAYLGAAPIADALAGGARYVITGRVADASLTLGPTAHAFGWQWDDWDRLAGGSVAGHLIECGSQVTGAYSVEWQGRSLADVGYPIAEFEADGSCVITKPPGTGGVVDRLSVAEQLVYEIGDPRHYLTPDVDVDFTGVSLAEVGPDRVRVTGARGGARPDTLKVSLAYRNGFMAAGQLLVVGRDAKAKADTSAEIIRTRLAEVGCTPERWHVELLGDDAREILLRLAVHDPDRRKVERFTREIAPLITSGPAGLAGYAAGRPEVRSVFAYWPTLVPRELVPAAVDVRTAKAWWEATS